MKVIVLIAIVGFIIWAIYRSIKNSETNFFKTKNKYMSKQLRPGSQAAADHKAMIRFCIVGTVIIVALSLLFYANLFDTYFYDYYKRAARFWKIMSIPCFAGSIYVLWKLSDHTWGERSAWLHGFFVLALLGLGFACASGWDWSLMGIED